MGEKKVAFLFPGQGAQYVGMGRDFYESFSSARELFQRADVLLGKPFSQLIFEGPQEELTQTKNSQLAIYIVSLAIHAVLQERLPSMKPSFCAGLSLGEYTALVASGKLSFEEGLFLVEKRAALMQDACISHPGSMRVVLGLDVEGVERVLSSLQIESRKVEVWIANLNCPGQVVIAGSLEGLEQATLALKAAGAKRILPLEVSGAFHSGLMKSAQERLTPFLQKVALKDSGVFLVMNTPGEVVQDLDLIRSYLIQQVTQPVRWQTGIEGMVREKVDLFLEMGCGKTLQGMNKKIGVLVPTKSLEKKEELEEVLCSIQEFCDHGNA